MTTNASASETVGLYGSRVTTTEQRQAFRRGLVPTAVYGMGKIGVPLAAVYAETTGAVRGVDIDPERVAVLNDGESPFENEPGLPTLLPELVENGSFRATTDGEAAATTARLHVIVVPTVLDEDGGVDLSNLRAAARTVAAGLTPGDLVVVESTVPPGTCQNVVAPILAPGDCDREEFGLAFCPERTASGHALRDIRGAYPKIVGGIDDESGRVAELVYEELTHNDVIRVRDARTAECVKLFEGVYRDVNIALANELAQLTDDLDVDVVDAIDAANTQPYCNILTPGAGVGGHCIPYYPHFLLDGVETDAPLISTARSINERMPEFVVRTVASELAAVGEPLDGATVALLGVTYRTGVPETREAPAIDIARRLTDLGATVLATDPLLDELPDMSAEHVSLSSLETRDLDAAVLVTAYDEFQNIDWKAFESDDREPPGIVVVDGRQALDLSDTAHRQYTIGRGGE